MSSATDTAQLQPDLTPSSPPLFPTDASGSVLGFNSDTSQLQQMQELAIRERMAAVARQEAEAESIRIQNQLNSLRARREELELRKLERELE